MESGDSFDLFGDFWLISSIGKNALPMVRENIDR